MTAHLDGAENTKILKLNCFFLVGWIVWKQKSGSFLPKDVVVRTTQNYHFNSIQKSSKRVKSLEQCVINLFISKDYTNRCICLCEQSNEDHPPDFVYITTWEKWGGMVKKEEWEGRRGNKRNGKERGGKQRNGIVGGEIGSYGEGGGWVDPTIKYT